MTPQCCSCSLPTQSCGQCKTQYLGYPKLQTVTCKELKRIPLWYDPCKRAKRRFTENYGLSIPVGVVASSKGIFSGKEQDLSGQRFAAYLRAMIQIYLMPEDEWRRSTLHEIIKFGKKLYSNVESNGEELEEEESVNYLTMYSQEEAMIPRTFQVNGIEFQVELDDKFRVDEKTKLRIPADLPLDRLECNLREYFKERNHCLVTSGHWYIMVWKTRSLFFVLDLFGRSLETFESNQDGHAMLMCLRDLRNVTYLIAELSGLKRKSNTCSLREMKIVFLRGPDRSPQTRSYGHRKREFVVVNDGYAYLKSQVHLSLNPNKALIRRCALPVGIVVLLASKIDPPITWSEETLQSIICFGVTMCPFFEKAWRGGYGFDNDDFPKYCIMGQFKVKYYLHIRHREGKWFCRPGRGLQELSDAIQESFEHNENMLLIETNQQFYAVWEKKHFFFLFDPYRHRLGDLPEIKSATLRMFSELGMLVEELNRIWLESNRDSKFYIHKLSVFQIKAYEYGDAIEDDKAYGSDKSEAASLNENICFNRDFQACYENLTEISDEEVEGLEEESEEEEKIPVGGEEEEGGWEGLEVDGDMDFKKGGKRKRLGKSKAKRKESKKGKGVKRVSKSWQSVLRKGGKSKRESKAKSKPQTKPKGEEELKQGDSMSNMKAGEPKGADETKADGTKPDGTKPDGTKPDGTKPDGTKPDGTKPDDVDTKEDVEESAEKDKSESKDKSKSDKFEKEGPAGVPRVGSCISDIAKGGGSQDTDVGLELDFDKGRRPCEPEFKEEGEVTECSSLVVCQPNNYPGYSPIAHDMAVVGSETGSYESICKLLRAGLNCTDRALLMTAWGNYVVFRALTVHNKIYFLFDGCTCNIDRFRHLDLKCGTAGLLCFKSLHRVVSYITDAREINRKMKQYRKDIIDDICRTYCQK